MARVELDELLHATRVCMHAQAWTSNIQTHEESILALFFFFAPGPDTGEKILP